MKELVGWMALLVAQPRECTECHSPGYVTTLQRADFMLCVLPHIRYIEAGGITF